MSIMKCMIWVAGGGGGVKPCIPPRRRPGCPQACPAQDAPLAVLVVDAVKGEMVEMNVNLSY